MCGSLAVLVYSAQAKSRSPTHIRHDHERKTAFFRRAVRSTCTQEKSCDGYHFPAVDFVGMPLFTCEMFKAVLLPEFSHN